MKYSYIFINQELLDILNRLGYVHFATKDQVESFKDGRAFYFCIENKQYGYVDILPYAEVENIKSNEEYLREEDKRIADEPRKS